MAYGGGLENRFRFQANVGSNPTPSARSKKVLFDWSAIMIISLCRAKKVVGNNSYKMIVSTPPLQSAYSIRYSEEVASGGDFSFL